ncbi:MAG: aminoacyl-tRNA hydrolase [Clostridia bacterium]
MKIVVGLGNIGSDYERTRHNLGFMFLDYISDKYNFKIEKEKLDSYIGEYIYNNDKVIFVKPKTFMNLSGIAALKVKNWYKVEDKDILIVYDDIDIPFEEIRYKLNGSGGSHNGMKNIVECLNSENCSRIRIGIGGLKHEKQSLSDFVLFKFTNEEQSKLSDIFKKTEDKLIEFLDK